MGGVECRQTAGTANLYHRRDLTQDWLPLLCSLPQVLTVARTISQPPHLACLFQTLGTSNTGGPSSSVYVDIQTAMTLQEAGACGPGQGGAGG